MPTFRPVLYHVPNRDGAHRIDVRITHARLHAYINTYIYIPKKDWNLKATLDKANWVRSNNPLADIYNAKIRKVIARLHALDDFATAAEYKAAYKFEKQAVMSFTEHMKHSLELLLPGYSWHTARGVQAWVNRFCADYPGLTFNELTPAWLGQYESALKKAGDAPNTVAKKLKRLGMFVKLAVKEGHLPYDRNPFLHHKIKHANTHRDKLTAIELEAIRTVPLAGQQALARDTFMLQFYLRGVRIGDLLRLTTDNLRQGRIELTTAKTKTSLSIEIPPAAAEIIARHRGNTGHLLPWLNRRAKINTHKRISSCTTLINRLLKEVATAAGVNKSISTHIARHTFADLARKGGMDIYALSKSLGHSSIKMTERYIASLDRESVDTPVRAFYEGM